MSNEYTTLQLPDFDGPCGPLEMADVWIQHRQDHLSWSANVSDECVKSLISLCYHASMAAEEGRYPRFRASLVDQHLTAESLYVTGELQEHVNLDGLGGVEALRKLSPAVSSFENALGLEEENGQLICTHLRLSQLGRTPPKLGWPLLFDNSTQGRSVEVRVNGPGEMDVSDGLCTLSLRRGKLTALAPWNMMPDLTKWLTLLGGTLASRVNSNEDAKLFGGVENAVTKILVDLWGSVLSNAVNRHRGAAFIVLPENACGHEPSYSYRSGSFSMAEAVWSFWGVCRDYVREQDPQKKDRIANRWSRIREKLVSKTRSLANLGRVDGCVVMDRDLQLRGFGGKIGFDEKDPKASVLPHFDLASKKKVEYELKGGMRHTSAYWLCQVVPGTIAFVVSQDGDLTVYFSDSDHAHAIKVKA